MRDISPSPALSKYAVFASTPCTSRKSISPAEETTAVCQCTPPSTVLANVPLLPLAHTTLLSTALTPLSRDVVPLVCACQRGNDGLACPTASAISFIICDSEILLQQCPRPVPYAIRASAGGVALLKKSSSK